VEVDIRRLRHFVRRTSQHLNHPAFACVCLTQLTSDQYDQELDSLLVGPIPVGVNKFIFEADAPKTNRIPDADILGVTVVLLTCAYDGREFVRVGYYVNNEYETDDLQADPPAKPIVEKIRRNVLADKPRVTRFAIKWYLIRTVYLPCCGARGVLGANNGSTGILRHPPPPSTLRSSPRPIFKPTAKNTALRS
jgi:hypothetical protein